MIGEIVYGFSMDSFKIHEFDGHTLNGIQFNVSISTDLNLRGIKYAGEIFFHLLQKRTRIKAAFCVPNFHPYR